MAAFTAIALGLAVGGAIVNAVATKKAANAAATGSEEAGKAQRRAAESQADLADYNAQVAELQATDAETRGVQEANRFRKSVNVMVGAQRAGFAAGNIDAGYGSAVDVQADAAFLGELDALTIQTNAGREAWGYRVQGEDLRRRGAIARKEGVYLEESGRVTGAAQRSQGTLGAIGTIAGTAGSLLLAKYGFGGR